MKRARPYAVLLAGATASGKSTLALRLADALNGEIIGADSLQIYRELPILTASPNAAEQAHVPHHLYNTQSGLRQYNVGKWQRQAWAHIKAICARGRMPIVVGGTGLYFQSLTAGLAKIPAVPLAIRQDLQARWRQHGADALWQELSRVDKATAARLCAADTQRVLRALGVYRSTGRPLSAWQATTRPLKAQWYCCVLRPDKAWLDARIRHRLDAQLHAGALKELKAFLQRKPPPSAPILQALGVKALSAHLRGSSSLDEAKAAVIQQTRQYAKRQTTWFRKYMADWKSYNEQQYISNYKEISAFIAKKH